MMTDRTPRDRVWLRIINALQHHKSIRIRDVIDEAEVSKRTAQQVMHIAEEEQLFGRETKHSHWFRPAIGFSVQDIEDPDYSRAIEPLIEEGTEDQS